MTQETNQGVYLNGRKQVIDLLQSMSADQRSTLLRHMQMKNPSLTKQLSEESLSFKDIDRLDDDQLRRIFQNVNPSITGLALYMTPTSFQKRCLKIMNRQDAEKAFNILSQNLTGKREQCKRAQSKVLQVAISLSRSGTIAV